MSMFIHAIIVILLAVLAMGIGRKKCKRKECFYRISSPPLRRKVTHWEPCEGCPYGKHSPCLGYCIVKAMKEVKEHRNTG